MREYVQGTTNMEHFMVQIVITWWQHASSILTRSQNESSHPPKIERRLASHVDKNFLPISLTKASSLTLEASPSSSFKNHGSQN